MAYFPRFINSYYELLYSSYKIALSVNLRYESQECVFWAG